MRLLLILTTLWLLYLPSVTPFSARHHHRPLAAPRLVVALPITSTARRHHASLNTVDDAVVRSNNKLQHTTTTTTTRLLLRKRGDAEDDFPDEEQNEENEQPVFSSTASSGAISPLLQETSKALRRVSFFSWWSQVILTTVSSVILIFARNILGKAAAAGAREAAVPASDPSFFLSGIGLTVSGLSILWTWGNGARLSRRLTRSDRPVSRIQAANMLRRAVRVGVTLNLTGLLVHLLAAEQIVGVLAVRVLTSSRQLAGANMAFTAMEGLQPLDVLIVQANTNSLLSHFCSLASLLLLTGRVTKLDPPSTEEGSTR